MRLTRREFTKLLALGLGAGAAVAGLPGLAGRAAAAGKPSPPAGSLDPALPLHPLLQYGARVEPDKVVRVIVQQARAGDDGRAIAAAHGARHLEEFAFVKTHHLEIKQGLLPGLARDPHVLHVAPDGPVQKHAISTKNLQTVYPLAIGADKVWNGNPAATGRGVAVAVLDTGLNAGLPDFTNPGSAGSAIAVNVNPRSATADDAHGHGTHVAGIVKGRSGTGGYIGIAPDCTLLSVKIADDSGVAHEADMLRGLQWVYDNRAGYGGSGAIRVVNLSVCSGTAASYRTSAICAAVEQLWLNGVVVVVAAGNRGAASDAVWYPPANDPYVITVGALDDNQTAGPGDDSLAVFSGRGATQDSTGAQRIYKPDLVAPGRRVVSTLAASTSTLGQEFASRITSGSYLRLSGTSMAAPVVAGVVAQILQTFPAMRPDQVKWLLLKVANPFATSPDGVRVVDPVEAQTYAKSNPWQCANQGLTPNDGIQPGTGAVAWGTAYWDTAYWDAAYWDAAYWDVDTSYD